MKTRKAITSLAVLAVMQLNGPLKPWIDKTWRPGEIELVK